MIAVGAFVDGNYDFSIPRLANGGHTTASVAANCLLNEHAKLFARVDNLFNLRYHDPTGFLQPSLAATGGVPLTD